FVGRGGNRDDLIVPRVESPGHAPNCAALAGGVPALDHDGGRDALLPRAALQQVETALLLGNLLVEPGIAQPLAEVEVVEHVELAVDPVDRARGVAGADGARGRAA